MRRIKTGGDVALLAWLAWLFLTALVRVTAGLRKPATATLRLTQVLWLFAAVAAAEALIFALRWWHHNMLLVGGDDTMTYEGYARDILLNGILMNGGLPPGQGEPFYYQAFYPYFLAGAHAVFGESMFGPVLLQRLLAALAMWKIVEIAVAFSSEQVWKVALPIAVLFVAWKFWPIAAQPLNESLYVPLLAATAASLIRLCRRPAAAFGVHQWPAQRAHHHHPFHRAAVVGDRVAGVLAGDERRSAAAHGDDPFLPPRRSRCSR